MRPHEYGYLRVSAAVPCSQPADVEQNTTAVAELWKEAWEAGADVVVFPELCISGYTCADLFLQQPLQKAVLGGLRLLCDASREMAGCVAVVGAPLIHLGRLYNCAVAISDGTILGVVPKTHLPNYNEFYEQRWFESSSALAAGSTIRIGREEYPFGTDILFNFKAGELVVPVSIEICEDLWTPIPPSAIMAQNGALIGLNLSASDELTGKHTYLIDLVRMHSARIRSGYVYASAGWGESTTDVVYAGNALIAEDGTLLAEGERFLTHPQLQVADIDVERLNADRTRFGTFCAHTATSVSIRHIEVPSCNRKADGLRRHIDSTPFVPKDRDNLDARCREIISIQTFGLMRRLSFTHCSNLVVGISGGLDSTLALLVACEAFKRLGWPLTGITGITMPGFGTTDRTHDNAVKMMQLLGVSQREISIAAAVNRHFQDIGQDPEIHDVTYENCQARERTQILMDYANKSGGMVLGTGDLSELALGWCTYNGDHISMYGVNASVPKTLVKHLVSWFATTADNVELKNTLLDVVETPISPELTPADDHGQIKQKTEDIVGPYILHDFFLYNTLRYGYGPRKSYMLAQQAFAGKYNNTTLLKWLRNFYRRFFSQQFKRSCMPDGPKVGSVCLSPRGDWRMPSDASAALWLKEVDSMEE